MFTPSPRLTPELLALPGLWCAAHLPTPGHPVWASGHALLDAHLPGGGWPCGALVEVLQAQPGRGEWSLVLPALVRRCSPGAAPGEQAGERASGLVLVGAPHTPWAPALQARGVPPQALLWVAATTPAQRLWACEQALQCPEVGAVMAWLPQASNGALRRLQWAATRWGGLLWVFRPLAAQSTASPAPLRLVLEGADPAGGLQLRLLKRRGPPLPESLVLPSQDLALQALLAAARWRTAQRRMAVGAPAPASMPVSAPVPVAQHAVAAA